MKRIGNIIYILLTLILAVSCMREELSVIEKLAKEEATVPVILSFQESVPLQAQTKAELGMEMGVNPAISNIHVAIFGTDRYLKDYVSAYPCDASGNALSGGFASQNATTAYFLARLPISSKERVLHIIANGPSSLPFNAYENDIMQNLWSSDGNGAYWQRIVLSGGITVQQEENEQHEMVPSQTTDGEYIPSTATKNALSDISLIRNFASFKVTENADNFELVSYTLCNMPSKGSIAMYSTNHGDWVPCYTDTSIDLDGDYFYNYEDDSNTVKTYLGFPANPELNTNVPTTEDAYDAPGVAVAPGDPIYVYERAVTSDNPPFILMAARYVSSGTPTDATPIHYYRLDIALENDYFPIYRNYEYALNISGVSVDGYSDPGDAAGHNSGSNFSISLDTRTLPDVSNGVVRLYVERPNFDWVYNSNTQSFWYKFQLNSDKSTLNGAVTVTEKEGNAINNLSVAGSDNADGSRNVSYKLNVPNGTSTLSSTLQLTGTYTSGGDTYRLVRMVTIRVFNAKEIHPTLTPATVADQEGQLTTLGIPLPFDLQASMFPMEILIEDSAKALNPASSENMPVRTTDIDDPDQVFKSLSGNNQPSYCFVRTLNWSEYQRLKNSAELSGSDDIILTCDFETTKAFGTTTVYVYNKYFTTVSGVTTAQVTLTGDQDNNITPNRQTISGTAASVTVKSTGAWTLSISLANGNVAASASLSPSSSSSSGEQVVSVTLPENVTENAIKYLLTLSTPSGKRTAYITQEGIAMSLTSATTNIGNGQTAVTVTVESGSRYVLELLNPDGSVASTSEEHDATTSATNWDVTIPQNTTLSARTFTIRARNLLSTVWRDITVTQAAGTATLDIVDSDIRMSATSATVNVSSSFTTYLKVYKPGDSEPTVTEIAAAAAHDVEITGIPANNSGVNRTIRVDLCNASGDVLRTGYITQLGVPFLELTATGTTSLGKEQGVSTKLSIDSDLAWTISVDGSATLSPASGGSTTSSGPQEITLELPANNTLSEKTYTVTASNGTANDYPHKTVTVTQEAGVASLAQVDSEIMMQETTARVSVTTSFPTRLKVFNNATNEEVSYIDINDTASNPTEKIVTVNANTGSAITYRVQLFNQDDTPIANTNSITFVQKPMIRITAANASVKGNENATVNVISDVDWTLSTTGGDLGSSATLAITTGSHTSGAVPVTLTMDTNYNLSTDEHFTVTVQGTGANSYLTDSVEITHRKASTDTGKQVRFTTTSNATHTKYTTSNKSVTLNGITGQFDSISSVGGSYMTIPQGVKLRLTSDVTVYEMTGVSLKYDNFGTLYYSNTGSVTTGSMSWGSTTTWTGNSTDFTMTLDRIALGDLRLQYFTVTYTGYKWE